MTDFFHEMIARQTRPLEPIATGVDPRLRPIKDIRAVMFDVYGTLLVSASGDVDACAAMDKAVAMEAAAKAAGVRLPRDAQSVSDALMAGILSEHEAARQRGVPHPEVELRDVWRDALGQGERGSSRESPLDETQLERLALEYELRVNPVWSMPHAAACLRELRQAGLTLGLISNAQFFTPILLGNLLGESLEALGLLPELQFYSYSSGHAKPGTHLYEVAAAALGERGVAPSETLFVGNDMLKDVMPAQAVGFRTALFAGDRRSYRPRDDDARLDGVHPDLVITELPQLVRCVAAI